MRNALSAVCPPLALVVKAGGPYLLRGRLAGPCPATRARGRNFTQPNQTPRPKPNRRRGSSKASAGRGRHRAAAMSALQSWRKAYGALKDSTTVSLANLNSDFKVRRRILLPPPLSTRSDLRRRAMPALHWDLRLPSVSDDPFCRISMWRS